MAAAIKRDFADLISMEDFLKKDAGERESAFLSRGLAALFARDVTGCDNAAAAACVVDGRDDYGIDAVAIMDGAPQIWLIQAKWSNKGTAGFGVGEALKLVNGLKRIDQRQYDRLNDRFSALADRVNAVLENARARITLLVVTMGPGELSAEAVECFEDAKSEFNSLGAMLDYEVRNAADAWQIVRNELTDQVTLQAKMASWLRVQAPFEAYQGNVSADEVAQWFGDHHGRLFEQNIRKSLGLTKVNNEIVRTLTENPDAFWYFNNGITVLCDTIEATPFSRSDPRGPVTLKLTNASVVNGAQTVAAAYEASRKNPDALLGAQVSVKVISIQDCPDGFATDITTATNTQNSVERRDFVTLKPAQGEIRDDFLFHLQKTYVFRRGELDPPPEAGCSIVEAAFALACAHNDSRLAVRIKVEPDELWQEGTQGIYTRIFQKPPPVQQIWRAVLLHRVIREVLHKAVAERQGRAAGVAEHGGLLLAHLVFQHVGKNHFDDSDEEWAEFVAEAPGIAVDLLNRMTHYVDAEFSTTSFIRSTFMNEVRCRVLVKRVLDDMASNTPLPVASREYLRPIPKKPRKPNAVSLLVDAARIPEGASLTFKTGSAVEAATMQDWFAENPSRKQATWVNERSKPILWAADGERYSPSGLVTHMWRLAQWENAPVAVQGTLRWVVPGQGTLVELADAVWREREADDQGELELESEPQ
ncbi:AIPR family protein [Streptosporangium sp. NPDC020072]|uniref:AIPR family protein n=1 Tax=unclassified Streptosporangium TaxID=2632669 RepID=UPI00332CC289